MHYRFIIFKNGSYIIASKITAGSLTWTINNSDIIEMSADINKNAIRHDHNTKTFNTYHTIRAIVENDNIHRVMISFLFLYHRNFSKQ